MLSDDSENEEDQPTSKRKKDLDPNSYPKKYRTFVSELSVLLDNIKLANEMIDAHSKNEEINEGLRTIMLTLKELETSLLSAIQDKISHEKLLSICLEINDELNSTSERYNDIKVGKRPKRFVSKFIEQEDLNVKKQASKARKQEEDFVPFSKPQQESKPQVSQPQKQEDIFDIFGVSSQNDQKQNQNNYNNPYPDLDKQQASNNNPFDNLGDLISTFEQPKKVEPPSANLVGNNDNKGGLDLNELLKNAYSNKDTSQNVYNSNAYNAPNWQTGNNMQYGYPNNPQNYGYGGFQPQNNYLPNQGYMPQQQSNMYNPMVGNPGGNMNSIYPSQSYNLGNNQNQMNSINPFPNSNQSTDFSNLNKDKDAKMKQLDDFF